MSFENVVDFGTRLMSDQDMQAEIQNAIAGKDDDEAAAAVAAIATKRGFSCTAEEVKEGYKLVEKMNSGEAEMSDQQLDFVVGGRGRPTGKSGGKNYSTRELVTGIFTMGASMRGSGYTNMKGGRSPGGK